LIFLSRFLHDWLQSLKKYNYDIKRKFWNNKKRYQKKLNITLISNPLKNMLKNAHKKSLTNMSKSEKRVHISVTFLLITFFWLIFSKLFQRIRNQRESLHFFIPIWNFWIKFFCSF
jgi:hypothetical protein